MSLAHKGIAPLVDEITIAMLSQLDVHEVPVNFPYYSIVQVVTRPSAARKVEDFARR